MRTLDMLKTFQPCDVITVSSRMCEMGTKGCEVEHVSKADRAAAERAALRPCPTCGLLGSHYAQTYQLGHPDPNTYRCAGGHFFTPSPTGIVVATR